MSSSTYSADLHPDPAMRRIVVLSGAGFCGIGVALILAMPLQPVVLITGLGGWLALCAWELIKMYRGYALCRRLRMSVGGELLLLDPLGNWHTARLLPGSVLLRRVGWIRLETGIGHRCAEPVRGSCRESDDWRRLQVIWRHIGATP